MSRGFDLQTAVVDMEALLEDYLLDLKTLVSIDSGTHDKAGVDLVGAWLQAQYEAMDGHIQIHRQGAVGDNIVVGFEGAGAGKVLLLGHMDTVYAAGTVAERPFALDGARAIGPGTCDMKAGVLSILYALRLLRRQACDSFASISILYNSDEEAGSRFSRELVRTEAEQADVVLVLEAGRENGDIVSARKGVATGELRVMGTAAHAGVNHKNGRSAIHELAHLIVALEHLNGTIPGVTLNVGKVEGGGPVNVVPDQAQARFELRAHSLDLLRETIGRVEDAVSHRSVDGTDLALDITIDHHPMHKSESTADLVRLYQSLAADIGQEVKDTATGGASDGNTAASAGRPVLDGLGPIGGGAHSTDEYVRVDSIAPRAALLAALIAATGSHVAQPTLPTVQ
ncbi:MAG: M20 family metallopeptidase [Chloroflexota bacterium]|nr:MAG: peptidase M20 [Chloroflexota bacterium]